MAARRPSRSGALSASGCEVGATPVGIDLAQLFGVLQDGGELPREEVALVGGERQPRQVRDALDFLGRQGGRHSAMLTRRCDSGLGSDRAAARGKRCR